MKNILLLLFATLSFHFANSQTMLLSNEIPAFGEVKNYAFDVSQSIIDTNIQGINVVWNYNQLVADTLADNLEFFYTDPTTTPYGINFPNSNYCTRETRGVNTAYSYFIVSNQQMERIGRYQVSLNSCTDSQIELVFPLEFGTTNYDTCIRTNYPYSGFYSIECIGSGTLILPIGSFSAIMARVYSGNYSYSELEYHWYDADNGQTLLTYTEDPYASHMFYTRFLTSFSTGIEKNFFLTDIKYNSLITTDFSLMLESKQTSKYLISIVSASGQFIQAQECSLQSGVRENIRMDFSRLSSGVYFCRIIDEKSKNLIKTLKLVKH